MTIDPDLLSRLRCTITRSPLNVADSPLLEKINGAIEAGYLTNRLGELLMRPLDEALVNEDESFAWPIYDDIVVLVSDEAIELSQLD